jgi:hypothetical protein
MSQMKLFENNNPDSNEKGIHPLHQVLEEFSLENSGRNVFHHIRTLLPGLRFGGQGRGNCFILLTGKKLIFRTKHSEMFLDCSTKKYMSIYFYYSDFFQVVKNDRAKALDFRVMLRNLKINNRTISCQTDILTKSEMKSLIQEGPIALDLDYSKTNQFRLSKDKNKVFYLAHSGKRILEDEMIRDSEKFEVLLQKYHIYRYEILELLKSKMKNRDA